MAFPSPKAVLLYEKGIYNVVNKSISRTVHETVLMLEFHNFSIHGLRLHYQLPYTLLYLSSSPLFRSQFLHTVFLNLIFLVFYLCLSIPSTTPHCLLASFELYFLFPFDSTTSTVSAKTPFTRHDFNLTVSHKYFSRDYEKYP